MRDIAELFLIEFVRNILDIKAPDIPIDKDKTESKEVSMQSSILIKKETKEEKEIPKFIPKIKVPQQIISRPKIVQKQTTSRPKINYSIQQQLSATEKLNTLIRDPYVTEIECNGAENLLSVRKSGVIQNTQINLSIEEIYEIIAEFSQKTRIPVINGRIKAALNDLIITAAMSESLGPRFIIQKKKPFQELII